MFNWTRKVALLCLLFIFHSIAYAGTGDFFRIDVLGISQPVNINLCLNGKGPLTCQHFDVSTGVLSITTTTPNHSYPSVGIKVNTPGYKVAGEDSFCTIISNGYCLFGVSDTSPATIVIIPESPLPPPGEALLIVSGSPLGLNVNGVPGSLSVTNISSTIIARNIIPNLENTALEGKVVVTGNTCARVSPGQSCLLTFTPGSTPIAETAFIIQGSNTQPASAKISISGASSANIIIQDPHLTLLTNGPSNSMTITNTSSSVTAVNINANFSGTALDGNVTETGNTCGTVLPGASCTLTFTPGATPVAETSFPIQGTNTTTATGNISISAPPSASISVSNSPLFLNTNGASGSLTITNHSTTVTATNIASNFAGTALDGNLTESGNTCSSVVPQSTCTLTYTPGSTAVPLTSFTIAGSNTNVINAEIQISNLTIGSAFGGGIVACLTSQGGMGNLITAVPNALPNVPWAPLPLVTTGATSATDGAGNTNTIVSVIGSDSAYAAGRCFNYQVDSEGNSPCRSGFTCYTDWFLAATEQLDCLYNNKNAIGGFINAEYWTSTESNKNSARAISFDTGASPNRNKANFELRIRCVRSFTP